jgi:indolepyruvate ferredoxin oxidoreductase, alpha subunit
MNLLLDKPGHRELLLGNEAIARGALEAGLEVATAYPGTPSSEIPDTLYPISLSSDLYMEYSTNEKVALEVAIGAADAGMRALCTMKHVGLNVAADPLNTVAYTGVKGALVVLTADEPSMHSSQNEQDNRAYAKLSLLPMLEPSSPAEAQELTRAAFELSERLGLPVLLRTTTRVSHSRGACTFAEMKPRRFQGHFDKQISRWAPVPAFARGLRKAQLDSLPERAAAMRALGVDRIEGEGGELGIVSSGVAYLHVRELLDELDVADRVRVAKVASIFPFPDWMVAELTESCRRILVVEELEPYIETEVRAAVQKLGADTEILGKEDGGIPRCYELSPDRIREAVAGFVGEKVAKIEVPQVPQLPGRPPMLCAGCTHRTTYYAVKSVTDVDPDTWYATDIGCYTLGLLPPLSTADAFICMGSSVTQASGVSIRNPQRHVAFIGDSTFFHSGMTGLVNAVHNRHDLLLVILDNSTTAMTGHQPHPSSELDERMTGVDIVRTVRGLGVENVRVVDPNDLRETIRVIDESFHESGVRVVISRAPCPLFARRVLEQKSSDVVYRVDQDRCKQCGHHLSHEPCGVPIDKGDEILRARVKIMTSDLGPMDYPAEGEARKPTTPPCTFACPANICVFGYLSLARAGRYAEALALIREQVPLPAVLGRVCHHPCEQACVRGDYDEPLAINEVKRFLTETESPDQRAARFAELREQVEQRDDGKRVAVVGAGPAGISAAHELRLRGHEVVLFEREKEPGGLLLSGIPPYRLPRDLARDEIEAVLSIGVELRTGVSLGRDFDLRGLLEESGFEAVCLAIGAHRGSRLSVPGEEAEGIEEALWFLRRVFVEDDRELGRQVMVVGGGDAAIDAARTAVRLGANKVQIVYRRTEEEMPAERGEIEAAVAEGVELICGALPVAFEKKGARVSAASVIRTEPGEPDASGRRKPVPVPGSEVSHVTDHVILAIGQTPEPESLEGDLELNSDERGVVGSDEKSGGTSDPRVFAAGDLTGRGWTVIDAIAQGRKAAAGIDRALRGDAAEELVLHELSELEDRQRYHPPAVATARRAEGRQRQAGERAGDFEEVAVSLAEEAVSGEAARCLSCGQCARCNNCIDNFGCPAIYMKEGRVYIDEVQCVGCGVCAQLCPNDAIVPVRKGAPVPESKPHREVER